MPEMRFRVLWPDGTRDDCYSPSLVVKDYLEPGRSYPVAGFVQRASEALRVASDRVEARYGVPCRLALKQLRDIESAAARQPAGPDAAVLVEAFDE